MDYGKALKNEVTTSLAPIAPIALIVAAASSLLTRSAHAQMDSRVENSGEPYDGMHVLSRQRLHDVKDESWNVYGQFTYISSWKRPFSAAYTNANGTTNSLLPHTERSFTASATLYLGLKVWSGTEAYFAPEVIAERPLSQLRGLGGAIQNFELQKTGGAAPQVYRSRVFLRQTLELGGTRVEKSSAAMQLGTTVDGRRLVLTVGNFSILDFFDRNSFTSDPRQQFFNMVFMTYAAYDFASDARGYSWGGTAELYWDDWVLRFGRITPPKNPNQLPVGLRLDRYYGDQLEIQHSHKLLGLPGAVRLLGYRNRELMGRFDDAIDAIASDPNKNATTCGARFNYDSTNAGAPDMCWVRKPNVKVGVGVSLEQRITEDLGLFIRGMVSDGQTEVQAYTSSDRSIAFGALSNGALWHRPRDLTGIGGGMAWISRAHAEYLRMGGVDGFIGDGGLSQASESVFEVFYSLNVLHQLWFSADYQHIANPAFNADRGPVNIFGGRAHAEF